MNIRHLGNHKQSLYPTSNERRRFKRDKDVALKEFLGPRLSNDTFMDYYRIDDLRSVANKLYRGPGGKFQTIWDETLALVDEIRSIETAEYGKKWEDIIYKSEPMDRQKVLLFYVEALMLNMIIRRILDGWDKCDVDSIYNAGLIYNTEYFEPPLSIKEFNEVWNNAESFVFYLEENDLVTLYTSHMAAKAGEVQKKISRDFDHRDIPRLRALYCLELLFSGRIRIHSVERIRELFLDYNKVDGKLPYHTLNCIWSVALNRASEHTLNYTKDGRLIKDMTEEEWAAYLQEHEQDDKRNNRIGSV